MSGGNQVRTRMGLDREVVDASVLDRSTARLGEAGVLLPTFRQLQNPATIPAAVRERLAAVDPDTADRLNLFRVHWFNDGARRGLADTAGARRTAARAHRG
jgi:hypothetical protein